MRSSKSFLYFHRSISSSLGSSQNSLLIYSAFLDGFSDSVLEVFNISDFLCFDFSSGYVGGSESEVFQHLSKSSILVLKRVHILLQFGDVLLRPNLNFLCFLLQSGRRLKLNMFSLETGELLFNLLNLCSH